MITSQPTKKVWVRFSFTGTVEVPANWDKGNVEFLYTDSSSCADNVLYHLKDWQRESGCLCHHLECTYLKDDENDPNIQS